MIKEGKTFAGLKNPYEHGFLPKIAYHIASNNPEKVSYFFNRQAEVHGPITSENMEFITKEVNKIHRIWEVEEKEFNNHLG